MRQNKIFGFNLSMLCPFLFSPLFYIEKRLTPVSIKTSVIIPCYYKHARYPPELLESFREQTVLPDEVVISLLEYKKAPDRLLESVNSTSYPFLLALLTHENPVSQRSNRNIACAQRVKVIKSFFEIII